MKQFAAGAAFARRAAVAAACLALAMLVSACGGHKTYKASATATCLKSDHDVRNVKLEGAQSFESREGVSGSVEADVGDYTVDVVFFKSPKDLKREFAVVRQNEAISLAATPAFNRPGIRRELESHDYVVVNTRVRWRRGTTGAVPGALRKTLASCLRES